MGRVLCGLLISAALTSQAVLVAFEGKVVGADGAPIAEATVSILGQTGVARTDEGGMFDWNPDPPVPFEVLVVLPGGEYLSPVLIEELPAEGPLLITATPLIAESVTVTAAATPNIESTPASGMNVIPQETIELRHPVRLTDVVETVPGSGRLSDLHAAVPSLRGLARGRTLILIDGARVTTERRAGPSATYLDPFFLEGVEISRGPGSVAYGSDAFGGIIHARTRRPEPAAPLHIRFHGSLGGGLPEKSAGVETSRGFAKGGWLFQARHRDFDEYRSPEGEVFNSSAGDSGFATRLSHETGKGVFTVGWQSDFGRDVGRPTTRSRVTRIAYPREDSHRLTLFFESDPFWGFTRADLHGFWGYHSLLTDRETLPNDEILRGIRRADVSAQDFGIRGLAVRPLDRARLELGVDINGRHKLEALTSLLAFNRDDHLLSATEELAIDRAGRTDAALYASTEVLLGNGLTGSGGIRFDRVTTRNQRGYFGNLTTFNSSLSGFASLKVEISPGLSLTGQVSRGFRDPTLSDRYYRGISGRGLVTGNPELEPEKSLQFDTALRYVREGFRFGLYAYSYRIDSLIERFESGPDLFFFRNSGRARLRGLELEVQGQLGDECTYAIGAQTAGGKGLEADSWLDDVPVENVTLEMRRGLGEGKYIEVRSALYGRDERPGPTEIATPRYMTVGLGGGWRLSPKLQLQFRARNLLDRAYPISPDRQAVLAPGRSAVVTLIAEF